jgi:hypothetical protein
VGSTGSSHSQRVLADHRAWVALVSVARDRHADGTLAAVTSSTRDSDETDSWPYAITIGIGIGLAIVVARLLSIDTGNFFIGVATAGVGATLGGGIWVVVRGFGRRRADHGS